MKKIDLGQTISIAANLGVIAGIVFLAFELSQNTAAMRSQTVHAIQSEFRENFDFPEGFIVATLKSPNDRSEEERFLRQSWFFRAMRVYENQWYQYSQGYLDEAFFRAYQQHLRITLGSEDFRQLWDSSSAQGFFHADFVSYVNSYIAENPPLTTSGETLR